MDAPRSENLGCGTSNVVRADRDTPVTLGQSAHTIRHLPTRRWHATGEWAPPPSFPRLAASPTSPGPLTHLVVRPSRQLGCAAILGLGLVSGAPRSVAGRPAVAAPVKGPYPASWTAALCVALLILGMYAATALAFALLRALPLAAIV